MRLNLEPDDPRLALPPPLPKRCCYAHVIYTTCTAPALYASIMQFCASNTYGLTL